MTYSKISRQSFLLHTQIYTNLLYIASDMSPVHYVFYIIIHIIISLSDYIATKIMKINSEQIIAISIFRNYKSQLDIYYRKTIVFL